MLDDWNASIIEAYRTSDPAELVPDDRILIRELAKSVEALSHDPANYEKRLLWTAHNSLKQKRPMIACDPENSWDEIIPESSLACSSKIGRYWEFLLRREMFWGEKMNDDHVVEPVFSIPFVYKDSGWGMRETRIRSEAGGSFTWIPPLQDYSALYELKTPDLTIDYEKTEIFTELAHDVMGDCLEIKRKGVWWWTLGLTMNVAFLRGLEIFMLDFYDHPDELHSLMRFLSDSYMQILDFLESNGLLTLNNDGSNCGSGGLGFTDELPQPDFDGKVRLCDLWGFSESQETVSVSPDFFEEFVFRYQLPLLARFGLNSYGCCEPLGKRWDVVKRIPNLRRVGVSPWSDMYDMADKLGKNFVYCLKPSPVPLASANMDKISLRKSIREAVHVTKNTNAEFIMQDTHTLSGCIQNVIDWCTIVREEIG
jgi:hypothetical protein